MTPRQLVIVLHDVAPSTQPAIDRVRQVLDAVQPGLTTSWLVVPRHHGQRPTAPWAARLDAAVAAGDELVLHGWRHVDDQPLAWHDAWLRRHYTAGEGEFAALDASQALHRLQAGRRWFLRHRWPLAGFVAPAWLLSRPSWQALQRSGFAYTCTLTRLVALPRIDAEGHVDPGAVLESRALVWSTRAAWRRWMSCAWNAAVARRLRDAPLLRLELHPHDADHASVRRSWTRVLEQALQDRQVVTLAAAADAARHHAAAVG